MGFNRVNPPEQVTLPAKIERDLELSQAFSDVYSIMFQMWKRLGGGADWVDESRQIGYEFDDISSLVDALLPKKPDIEIVTEDYTTIGDQTIICNAALTVFLNKEPRDREKAKVIIANGNVTVNGNGKKVNKDTDQTVIFKNLITTATLDIVYILDSDEWFIV